MSTRHLPKTAYASASSSSADYRAHSIAKLSMLLGNGPDTEEIATQIEEALHARFAGPRGYDAAPAPAYSAKLRSLLFNLSNNNELVRRIKTGQLGADELVALSPEDMLPREEREKQQEAARKAFDLQRLDHVAPQVAAMEDKAGGITCRSCGSKRVGTVRRNAVSDVEEAMVECSCQSCGATWVSRQQTAGERW